MGQVSKRAILAYNLRELMDRKQKTVADLSRELNISYSTIRDWTTGTTYPRIEALEQLADYFGIDMVDLVADSAINNRLMKAQYAQRLSDLMVDLPDSDREELITVAVEYAGADLRTKQIIRTLLYMDHSIDTEDK